MGRHVMAPHTAAVADLADRKDLIGQARTLMVWGGASAEQIFLHDWAADGQSLFVTRWSAQPDTAASLQRGSGHEKRIRCSL